MGTDFQFHKIKSTVEMNGGDAWAILGMHLISLNFTFESG